MVIGWFGQRRWRKKLHFGQGMALFQPPPLLFILFESIHTPLKLKSNLQYFFEWKDNINVSQTSSLLDMAEMGGSAKIVLGSD
jgi:hypothetical protein